MPSAAFVMWALEVPLEELEGDACIEAVTSETEEAKRARASVKARLGLPNYTSIQLAEPLPILGNNTTSQPIRRLFLYSPYTSPTISPLLPHYQYQYRNNRLPHPYKRIIPIFPTTIPQISLLLPHYQDQYRNNQLPHPYSLRWYGYPKVGKGSLIDFARFCAKGVAQGKVIAPLLHLQAQK